MNSNDSKLETVRAFSVYLVTNVFIFLLPVAATPIFARYLSPGDFGIWAIYLILNTYFVHCVRFELQLVTKRAFKNNPEALPDIFFLSCLIIVALGFCLFLLVAFGYPIISDKLGEYVYVVWVALFGSVLKSISMLAHGYMQVSGRVNLYSIVNITANYALYALAIYFVVMLGLGIKGRVYADMIISLGIAAHAVYFFKSNKLFNINFQLSSFQKNLSEAWSPFLLSAFVISLANLDKILIGAAFDKSQLGLYIVALQFASLLTILTSSLAPILERVFYNPSVKFQSNKSFVILILSLVLLSTVVFSEVVSYAIFVIMPAEFLDARDYSLLASTSILSSFLVALGVSIINAASEIKKILFPFACLTCLSFFFGYIILTLGFDPRSLVFVYFAAIIIFAGIVYREVRTQ